MHKVLTIFTNRTIFLSTEFLPQTMLGGEENPWFPDALKHSILELILPEKTLKGINCFFKPLIASVALISIDWFLYECNTGN